MSPDTICSIHDNIQELLKTIANKSARIQAGLSSGTRGIEEACSIAASIADDCSSAIYRLADAKSAGQSMENRLMG